MEIDCNKVGPYFDQLILDAIKEDNEIDVSHDFLIDLNNCFYFKQRDKNHLWRISNSNEK